MSEQFSQWGRHIFEGVEVLRYSIDLNIPTDREKIREFYRGVYENALLCCENELCRYAADKYGESDDPKKRYDYVPIRYRLEGKTTFCNGDMMFIKLTAELRGKGATERVYDAHVWSLTEQCLLPPKMAARSFLGKGKLPKGLSRSGFLVENGKPFICQTHRLIPLESKASIK